MKILQPKITRSFEQTAQFIFVPTNEYKYNQIVTLLDEITDIVRDNEVHLLANLMDVLGVLVETYEDQYVSEPESDPVSVLKHFMSEYNLKHDDLPELGSHDIVSDILNGDRELDVRQIRALSKRFNVSVSVFI